MTGSWSADELTRIGGSTEVQVTSTRPDGTLRPFVTIWIVRVGEDLYIRSAYGSENPWFRRAKASAAGRVLAGGLEIAVTFADAAVGVHADIDAAYHAKYDAYGTKIVGSVVGRHAAPNTFRVIPQH